MNKSRSLMNQLRQEVMYSLIPNHRIRNMIQFETTTSGRTAQQHNCGCVSNSNDCYTNYYHTKQILAFQDLDEIIEALLKSLNQFVAYNFNTSNNYNDATNDLNYLY